MKKIDVMTPEIRERMEHEKNRWIGYAVNPKPVDINKAANFVNYLYDKVDEKRPEVLLVDGPIALKKALEDRNLEFSKSNIFYTYSWWNWVAYASVFKGMLDHCTKIAEAYEDSQHCHIIYPIKDLCFVLENPVQVRRDDDKRLHCEDGPALAYKDGFKLWRWHGIKVPEDVVLDKSLITKDRILSEDNAEVRRCLMEMKKEDVASMFELDLVSFDPFGKLYKGEVEFKNEKKSIAVVEVINSTPEPDGTFKTYWLKVPSRMNTAQEAVSWTFRRDDYNPSVQT